MAYEYEKENKEAIMINPPEANKELQQVYDKAKAFDEIKKFTTERLKEQELTDEYDYGERFMCEEIERLLEDKQND
ncbi:MAG: hypothetical protein L0J01_09350 [Tetragenococcus halophilus]|nr:hypothetical protein [Tetragenococcus halophilus]